jgi:hypothetical protein
MRGIRNLGNTCHFSSAIQCLLALPLPTRYDGECAFTRSWVDFVRRHAEGGDALDPEPLFREFQKHFPRIDEFEENDLQETLLLVVDILEKQFPLREMFYGTKIQETVYPGGTNTLEDAFSVLILPMAAGGDMGTMMKKSCEWSVLSDFTDTSGKTHNVATTRTMIKKFPKVAMFTFDRKGTVVAPTGLTTDQGAYTLVAAGAHVGTQGGGHYVSLVRDGEQWYLCDDERVAPVTFESRFEYSLLVYLKI